MWLSVAFVMLPSAIQAQDGVGTPPESTASEAPTSLTGNIDSTGVVLSWSAPTLETDTLSGYEVARRRVLNYETSWVTIVEDTDSLDTSYTDAAANVNGAEYEYRVHALRGEDDDQVRSAASNVIAVTIPNPPRPQDLTATSTTSGVQLSWSAGHLSWQSVSLSLNGYEIRRIESRHADNRNPQWEVLVDNTNSANTSYLDASGYTTIQYSYAIRAVHGFLRSYWEGDRRTSCRTPRSRRGRLAAGRVKPGRGRARYQRERAQSQPGQLLRSRPTVHLASVMFLCEYVCTIPV